jgi:hypothetical protein
VASPLLTRVITGSITIQYLGSDVLAAGADENDLTLYFWDGHSWSELDTVLDTYFNMASASSQGTGVYALMASVKIPLYGAGWNLVSYPLPGTRAITEALRSIEGSYGIVYGYVMTDTADPWRVHSVDVPAYVNRLHALQFGRGYWISATRAITWYLSGGPDLLAPRSVASSGTTQSPPATYYGSLLAGQGFTPTAGMTLTAWIDGKLCGQSSTLEVGGEVVYSIHVSAGDPGGVTGCGELGKAVMFQVDSRSMAPAALWNNNRLWEHPLRPAWSAYLPVVVRH